MDFSKIGTNIKELSKSLGISQKELADGICTQAQISKIENGSIYPLSTTLYLIARRLGVDVNYFFDICETPRMDYVNEVMELIRQYIRKREYEKVYTIVKTEKKTHCFLPCETLTWHEGICVYYLHKKVEEALSLLNQALSLTLSVGYSLREIEILNSIGIIYCEEGKYEQANNFF
jgi:transcriptional regulator with XRE-family HTH domain